MAIDAAWECLGCWLIDQSFPTACVIDVSQSLDAGFATLDMSHAREAEIQQSCDIFVFPYLIGTLDLVAMWFRMVANLWCLLLTVSADKLASMPRHLTTLSNKCIAAQCLAVCVCL